MLGRLLPECPMQSTQRWTDLLTSGFLVVSLSDETPREISRRKKKVQKWRRKKKGKTVEEMGRGSFSVHHQLPRLLWQREREKEKRPGCACLKLLYFFPECRGNDGIK